MNTSINTSGQDTIDCLLIGFYDIDFRKYVAMVKAMGTSSGAYRDLRLHYVEHNNTPYHCMGLINHFMCEEMNSANTPLHNADFLWPTITYLATYLSRRSFSFDYINLFHMEKEQLKENLLHRHILTIAITTTLYVSPQPILDIISFIREYNTTAQIIVGGPYIFNQFKNMSTTAIQHLLHYIGADFYVNCSEGELALTRIISALKNKSDFYHIDNIAYKRGKTYVITQSSVESNSLEENMVDYTLFKPRDFGDSVTLRSAKSCPFSCAFCSFPQRAGLYTYMGVDMVEKELNAIRDIDTITSLTFIDDTFNVPKGRFKQLLRMMIRNKYGFKWNCYYRSDHGDEETIALMREAGCEGVFLGIESGSDEQLERMNKTARKAHYRKAISSLRGAGIITHANLIVGFPGETIDTVQETMDFIEEVRPDFFRAQLWYCDQTTPIWRDREKYGIQGAAFNWSHHTMDAITACNLIDRLFFSIQHSVWLPQNSFELWSIFYLQRRGWLMKQIREFLQCFNTAVKENISAQTPQAIRPELYDRMRAICLSRQ